MANEHAGRFDPAELQAAANDMAMRATEMLQRLLKRGVDVAFDEFAPGVARLGVVFVNVYVLNAGEGRWVLVDTGLPGFAQAIRTACERRFDGRPPEAIVLTHAHFDHAGNVEALARDWNVPVYAHRLEMPYLTGGSNYPPGDPTPGGAICFLSRFFPTHGYDLRGRVDLRPLPEEGETAGTIPGLTGWRWLHTPGHTVGHVSLFRDYDKLLLAGDALATMDMDSWPEQFKRDREVSSPPTPLTPDWPSTRSSIAKVADLEPRTVAAGHGLPLWGRYAAGEVAALAETLQPPSQGRYTGSPARFDEQGRVTFVPPPPPDPVRSRVNVGVGLAVASVGLAVMAALIAGRRR